LKSLVADFDLFDMHSWKSGTRVPVDSGKKKMDRGNNMSPGPWGGVFSGSYLPGPTVTLLCCWIREQGFVSSWSCIRRRLLQPVNASPRGRVCLTLNGTSSLRGTRAQSVLMPSTLD